jgi:SAM-dependent methyltransferase
MPRLETEWNEERYLLANPDVARAVRQGSFKTGLAHFLAFGKYEDRAGVPSAWIQPTSPGLQVDGPWPAEHLRLRVHGGRDLDGYVRAGKMVAQDLQWALGEEFGRMDANSRVLDFGCGPGRVLTWLQSAHKGWRFTGTDIDPESIAWARSNLSHVASFECNASEPPLQCDDAQFDFVYSISVFTHLPEGLEMDWLRELRRVAKPGALLALSVHGEDLRRGWRRMPASGFLYARGRGTAGLPRFYQTSFHTSAYINREWSKIFRVESILEKHVTNHHDLVICRRT